MVRWWSGAKPIAPVEFESQQTKLQRMSREVFERYRAELDQEVADPVRLAAIYGAAFASVDSKRQAEVVCLMATSMLTVPNAEINLIAADRQVSVAVVHGGAVVADHKADVPLCDSYCKNVIATGREFAVEAAQQHPLVCDTKFAKSGEIVSYLGVPIVNGDGIIVGVLCVFDSVERDWGIPDVSMLTQLSLVLTRALMADASA